MNDSGRRRRRPYGPNHVRARPCLARRILTAVKSGLVIRKFADYGRGGWNARQAIAFLRRNSNQSAKGFLIAREVMYRPN